MVIRVLDIAGGADTRDQGQVIYAAVLSAFAQQRCVTISFAGVDIATSSFVNASFVRLLDSMTLGEIKSRLRVIETSRQIGDMIKRRLDREATLLAA